MCASNWQTNLFKQLTQPIKFYVFLLIWTLYLVYQPSELSFFSTKLYHLSNPTSIKLSANFFQSWVRLLSLVAAPPKRLQMRPRAPSSQWYWKSSNRPWGQPVASWSRSDLTSSFACLSDQCCWLLCSTRITCSEVKMEACMPTEDGTAWFFGQSIFRLVLYELLGWTDGIRTLQQSFGG